MSNTITTGTTSILIIQLAEYLPTINTVEDVIIKSLQATIAIITIINLIKSKRK
jgi:hypothetical protein